MADRDISEICSLEMRSLSVPLADPGFNASELNIDAFFIINLGDSNGETLSAPGRPAHA